MSKPKKAKNEKDTTTVAKLEDKKVQLRMKMPQDTDLESYTETRDSYFVISEFEKIKYLYASLTLLFRPA